MIEIIPKTSFFFSSTVDDYTYKFTIVADSEESAKKQLSKALHQMADELDATMIADELDATKTGAILN